ncbi:sialin isoform X1 [Lepeophtheirus salmonis]|nr:sialin-like isoform X1 [Lepeophtheirus salmonis]XP_040572758.1 sialin-like isoform X1 [Lepeophtheirus salmonis]
MAETTASETEPIRTKSENYGLADKDLEEDLNNGKRRRLANICEKLCRRRYVVAGLAFFGFCVIYMLRVNLSVAIVAMTSKKVIILENGSEKILPPEFRWESSTQGLILGSFFYGYIVTQIPGGFLATRFGGKRIFLIGIAATAFLTILTPILTKIGTGFLITTRILEGLFEGMTYPSIHAIWAKWAPPLERSRLAAVAFSGSYVGTVIALPLSGLLAQHVNWESIFYVFGCIGLIWCALWAWVVKDSPEDDTKITESELEYLRSAIGVTNEECLMTPPWKKMLSSKAVWAIIIAHFAENWGFYTLLTGLPMFMRDVLKYKLDQAGFLAALPYLLMACIVQSAGVLADLARTKGRLSTTQVRKLFTCGSYSCQAFFMTLTALLMQRGSAITCISLSLGCGGFAWAGFSINHLDIAPQYAAILMGISNTIGTIPGILSPALTGFIVQDKTPEEWQYVFFITASVYFVGGILYGFMASGERQDWSKIEGEDHIDGTDVESVSSVTARQTDYGTN